MEKQTKKKHMFWKEGRISLTAQWLRIRLSVQGTRIRSLVQEDPTCCGATRPVCHDDGACTLDPALWNKKPPQWKGCTLQREGRPPSPQLEKACTRQWRPSTAETEINNNIFSVKRGLSTVEFYCEIKPHHCLYEIIMLKNRKRLLLSTWPWESPLSFVTSHKPCARNRLMSVAWCRVMSISSKITPRQAGSDWGHTEAERQSQEKKPRKWSRAGRQQSSQRVSKKSTHGRWRVSHIHAGIYRQYSVSCQLRGFGKLGGKKAHLDEHKSFGRET